MCGGAPSFCPQAPWSDPEPFSFPLHIHCHEPQGRTRPAPTAARRSPEGPASRRSMEDDPAGCPSAAGDTGSTFNAQTGITCTVYKVLIS